MFQPHAVADGVREGGLLGVTSKVGRKDLFEGCLGQIVEIRMASSKNAHLRMHQEHQLATFGTGCTPSANLRDIRVGSLRFEMSDQEIPMA